MRVGLVLGAGGLVGSAWHAGVLGALEETTGWDPRTAEVIVGTSAGSMTGARLRGGVTAATLAQWRSGRPSFPDAVDAAAARSSRPSAELLARAVWSARPALLAAAMAGVGRVPTEMIGDAARSFLGETWPGADLRVCAVRARDGARVVFGAATPTVRPADAVRASCAIPGFFRPVVIDGERYVDGGVHSPTNADVVAGEDLDVVVVSSPMSLDRRALRRPSPRHLLRIAHRTSLQRELVAVRRRANVHVITLQPGPEDLAVMGATGSGMDPRRRPAVLAQARATTARRAAAGAFDRLR